MTRRDATASRLLSPSEKNGRQIFIGKGQCITCHSGPLLTDQQFHNTGITPRLTGQPDLGRHAAIAKVLSDKFNRLDRYSSARAEQCEELQFLAADEHAMEEAFKTPGLRNIALRASYMHSGQMPSLDVVVRHYSRAPEAAAGQSELKPFDLSEQEVRDLVAFLGSLTGERAPRYQ